MLQTYKIAGLSVNMDSFGRNLEQARPYLADFTPAPDITVCSNWERLRANYDYLSEDDGESWKYKKIIGNPDYITSYPDVDFYDGKIYLTYDRGRTAEKEIYLSVFTEEDVINPDVEIVTRVISKGAEQNLIT